MIPDIRRIRLIKRTGARGARQPEPTDAKPALFVDLKTTCAVAGGRMLRAEPNLDHIRGSLPAGFAIGLVPGPCPAAATAPPTC